MLRSPTVRVLLIAASTAAILGWGWGAEAALAAPAAVTTILASATSTGTVGNAASSSPSVSSDGRYVAFVSSATNLVTGDTNGVADVFVKDTVAGTVTRVSTSSSGAQANGASSSPSIRADGSQVAFVSTATNLVPSDTNGVADIFVKTLASGAIYRPNWASAGGQASGGASDGPSISSDGRYVVFQSDATNLVSGDTNAKTDIFIRDHTAKTTTRLSVSTAGVQSNGPSSLPTISGNANIVGFVSTATNLVSSDTNGVADDFIRDRAASTTTRGSWGVSGQPNGASSGRPSLSTDGRYVAFSSKATNLVSGDTNGASDIFVRDRTGKTTTRASVTSAGAQSDGNSLVPSISGAGTRVEFFSAATNLVAGDTNAVNDAFVRDTVAATTTRVSVTSAGAQATGQSYQPAISSDGMWAYFGSDAANLVSGDTNGAGDVFGRGPLA